MSTDEPKDGFDLIEYPCQYSFKAMCRIDNSNAVSPSELMRSLVLQNVAEELLLSVQSKQSKGGKYEAVTLSVQLQNRQQLENIYQSISSSPLVVMTL